MTRSLLFFILLRPFSDSNQRKTPPPVNLGDREEEDPEYFQRLDENISKAFDMMLGAESTGVVSICSTSDWHTKLVASYQITNWTLDYWWADADVHMDDVDIDTVDTDVQNVERQSSINIWEQKERATAGLKYMTHTPRALHKHQTNRLSRLPDKTG